MAQTRYLRTVIRMTIRERLRALWHGRIAISATVRPDRLDEIKVGPFPGTSIEAEAWIKTGSRTAAPQGTIPFQLKGIR